MLNIFSHEIVKKFCKILILLEKLEFKYDILQSFMLNPFAEWKLCRSLRQKVCLLYSFRKLLGDLPPPDFIYKLSSPHNVCIKKWWKVEGFIYSWIKIYSSYWR